MLTTIEGINLDLVRKPIRNLRITVLKGGLGVRVSAPLYFPTEQIRAFVKAKKAWILKTQARLALVEDADTVSFSDGKIVLFGVSYPVNRIDAKSIKVVKTDFTLNVYAPSDAANADINKAVERFCRKLLSAEIASRLPVLQDKVKLYADSWHIKNMTTRWGSCNTANRRLWFSLRLVHRPLVCLDFIIIHELGHIRIPNHGESFKAYMDENCPDWRKVNKLLA